MPGILDLSDIQIPPEDANKPAEIDITSPEGDDKPQDPPAAPAAPPVEDKPADPPEPSNTPVEENKPDEESNTDTPAAPSDPPADTGWKAEDGFHNHPDWKKREQQLKELQDEVERLKTAKPAPVPSPDDNLSPEALAEKRVREAAAENPPKDQLELNRRYTEELSKINSERAEQLQTRQAEAMKQGQKMIDDKLDQLSITDEADRKKVREKVQAWYKQGIEVNVNSFDIAAENLRLKGEIKDPSKPAAPPQTEASKLQEKADQEARDKANKRISRPKSDGKGGDKKSPISYKKLHTMNLDEIVAEQAKAMG